MREDWQGLLLFGAIAVGCLYLLAFQEGGLRILAAFVLGAVLTGLAFGWLLGFDAHSLRWAWGAWGEQWTAEELEKLDAGSWSVYHDLPDGRANWDHVVVGPPGVFLIDTKNFSEPAVVDEKGIRSGRLRAGGAATRGSAVRLKEAIERDTGLAVWVQGVVAVWGELPAGVEERDKVLYVPAPKVTEVLTDLDGKARQRLTERQRVQVGALLNSMRR